MPPEVTPIELAKYRVEKAKEDLSAAKLNFKEGLNRVSVNRSYYAIFHATRALLALERIDYKKHSGVISHFHKNYVKTGLFDNEYGKIVNRAFDIRNDADYEDFYLISKEDIAEQIENAERFICAVEAYLK